MCCTGPSPATACSSWFAAGSSALESSPALPGTAASPQGAASGPPIAAGTSGAWPPVATAGMGAAAASRGATAGSSPWPAAGSEASASIPGSSRRALGGGSTPGAGECSTLSWLSKDIASHDTIISVMSSGRTGSAKLNSTMTLKVTVRSRCSSLDKSGSGAPDHGEREEGEPSACPANGTWWRYAALPLGLTPCIIPDAAPTCAVVTDDGSEKPASGTFTIPASPNGAGVVGESRVESFRRGRNRPMYTPERRHEPVTLSSCSSDLMERSSTSSARRALVFSHD
mmetsp:Transcript_706/g.2145  ORF Transcript_706/g.2145 Transcript_706/m.2145 type:complete len:285 (+) Transcript_706:623-1477(+)